MTSPTEEIVRKLVIDHLAIKRGFTLEETLEELGADSLDYIELAMAIEESFDVDIPDEELENIKTVGDLLHVARRTMLTNVGENRL